MSIVLNAHTSQVVLALGDYMSVQCHACIGGTNVGEDIRKLDYGQVTRMHSRDNLHSLCCSTLWWERPAACLT